MRHRPIRILLAGEGAIAGIHMEALQGLEGAEVACVAGGLAADTAAFAERWGIPGTAWTMPMPPACRACAGSTGCRG